MSKANKPVYQSDSYDTKLEKQAPFTFDIQKEEKKAIVEALYRAKQTIDNMYPNEREVHSISQGEIRELEKQVRGKLSPLSWENETWQEITLTKDEIKAIEGGLVDMLFDENFEMSKRHKKLDNVISHETNPRKD